ncbi:EH signature domain-containing protein [Cereibacter sphaeroides]|uniref:EH signature domain-containing protein n=1 Tax=Cereibacter sphaeroides TaxID=1063 RepID=UPI0039904EE6
MTESLSEMLQRMRTPQMPSAPSFEQIERSIEKVIDRFGTPQQPVEKDPERLLQEMQARIESWTWEKVPMGFVSRVGRLVFSAPWRDCSDWDLIRDFLIGELAVSTRPGLLNPFVQIYIGTFDALSSASRRLGNALEGARARLGVQWRQLVAEVPEFFDVDQAPRALAKRMMQMDDIWVGLRRIGLRMPHAPGLMDAAHLAFLTEIGPGLTQRAEIERLLSWLRPAGQPARAMGAAEAISALLRPWQRNAPPKDIQALLIDRLTELYGHPKVNRHAVWNLVDPGLEQLVLRWLMGADIRFLFRVLHEVERGHMWRDREDFWWLMYETGRIDEVWIAFNHDGFRTAMAKLSPDERRFSKRFGHQIGERDKSLLIMRIGNKIVVEGTFNFKVHIFETTDRFAPRLYQQKYDVADIRSRHSALTKSHLGDWQSWVRRHI